MIVKISDASIGTGRCLCIHEEPIPKEEWNRSHLQRADLYFPFVHHINMSSAPYMNGTTTMELQSKASYDVLFWSEKSIHTMLDALSDKASFFRCRSHEICINGKAEIIREFLKAAPDICSKGPSCVGEIYRPLLTRDLSAASLNALNSLCP